MAKKTQTREEKLRESERKHEKFLKGVKYRPRSERPQLDTKKSVNVEEIPQTINREGEKNKLKRMGWPGFKKNKNRTTQRYTVAPAYNKGPYMVISKDEVKNIGR